MSNIIKKKDKNRNECGISVKNWKMFKNKNQCTITLKEKLLLVVLILIGLFSVSV